MNRWFGGIQVPVWIIYPFTEDGLLDLLDKPGLLEVVGDRVSRHVEQEEVLLLSGENSLLNQVLSQPLPHVLQLVSVQRLLNYISHNI